MTGCIKVNRNIRYVKGVEECSKKTFLRIPSLYRLDEGEVGVEIDLKIPISQ